MDKFERYWKLSEMEERFNSSSGGIRGLSSAWLLASLGAIGWIFSTYNAETWPLPMGFLVIVVTTLGSIGITTLWVMDQLVFFRLLNSVFLVGLKVEKDDCEIPPIRSVMMKAQEGLGTHRWERFFYMTPILIYLLLSVVIIIGGSDALFLGNKKYFDFNTRYISTFLVLLQISALTWMLVKFRSISQKGRAAYFGDKEFTELVDTDAYEITISRFHSETESEVWSKANKENPVDAKKQRD